jgi:hypothetical protein
MIGVATHAQGQVLMESSRGKMIWKGGVAPGPILFRIF